MHIISICTAAHAKSFNWFSCIFVADWQIFTSKKSLYKCSGVLFVLMYERLQDWSKTANIWFLFPPFLLFSWSYLSPTQRKYKRLYSLTRKSRQFCRKSLSFTSWICQMIRKWRMCSFWFVQVLKKQSRTFSSHKTFICCYQTHSASNLL